MHIGAVSIFEGPAPPLASLEEMVLSKLDAVPRYRQKVRFVPLGLGRPVWFRPDKGSLVTIPVVATSYARASHTTALRVARTRAFGSAGGGPHGFAVGIDVLDVHRDSRRIHRLRRCHTPCRGSFGLAGTDSRRGRLGRRLRTPGSAETAEQTRQPCRTVCTG